MYNINSRLTNHNIYCLLTYSELDNIQIRLIVYSLFFLFSMRASLNYFVNIVGKWTTFPMIPTVCSLPIVCVRFLCCSGACTPATVLKRKYSIPIRHGSFVAFLNWVGATFVLPIKYFTFSLESWNGATTFIIIIILPATKASVS